jgi:hypothetical protein
MKRLSAIVCTLSGGAILLLLSGCKPAPQQNQSPPVPSAPKVGDTRYATEELMADGGQHTGRLKLHQDNKWYAEGPGTKTYPDGRKYDGEFHDGKFSGRGTMTGPTGEMQVGEFRDGLPNGQGTHTFPDGTKYVGEFRDGLPNGQGTETRPDGRKYVGEWRDGKRNGQGTQTSPSSVIQAGPWQDDKFVGQ